MSQEQYDAGMRERKAVLGAEYVDKALAASDSFNREFQRMVTEYCWGGTWAKGVLSLYARLPDGRAFAATHRDDWRAFLRRIEAEGG